MSDVLTQPVHSGGLIAEALSRDLDRLVAIGSDGTRLTARELAETISRLEQFFETLEPKPVCTAILARNRLEILAVSNSMTFAGIVMTMLHPMGSVEDFLYVIEDAGIDTLIYDELNYETAAGEIAARAPRLRHIFSMGAGGTIGRDLQFLSKAFLPRRLVAQPLDPEAVLRIAYSGGTTGKPKGVMVPVRSIITSTLLQLTSWEWPKEIRHLICAPLSHSGAAVLTPILMKNGVMVVLGGFDPVKVMAAIEEHRITSVLMVPTMVIALMDHPHFSAFDLSSLEVIFYGASAFPAARLRQAIQLFGPVFFQFYGQAEAPMSVTVMRRDEHDVDDLTRLASCGRPTPMIRVALLDDDDRAVADGEPGEICVRGPLVMAGYFGKPEETAKAFAGDWLRTGDIAVRGPDGFLRIVDRKKDMIITGGFNVYAREVEDVLVEQPGVRMAAVIGVPDPKWGEAVKAVVVLEPGATIDAPSLIAAVRERKGAVQAPKSIDFVDVLPLSPLGKPDKKALRQRYAARTPSA